MAVISPLSSRSRISRREAGGLISTNSSFAAMEESLFFTVG